MEKLRNKNTIVLIISALLIVTAIIVAVVATATAGNDKKAAEKTTTEEAVELDLEAIANMNSSNKDKNDKNEDKADKADDVVADDSTTEATEAATEKPVANNSSAYATGTYKVATQEDPLGMRIQPNADADRLLYIDKGTEVEVLAVWGDWGYVVYNSTGGWLSMNYLELVSGN